MLSVVSSFFTVLFLSITLNNCGICLWVNIWVVSNLELLWIDKLWAFVYQVFGDEIFSFLWGKYLLVEFLGYIAVTYLLSLTDFERETGGTEREGERESQASSVLSAQSPTELILCNHEIMTWAETKSQMPTQLSHPSAPCNSIFNIIRNQNTFPFLIFF